MKLRGCRSKDHKLLELRNKWHRTIWNVHKEGKDQKKNPFIMSSSNSTQKQLEVDITIHDLQSILVKSS